MLAYPAVLFKSYQAARDAQMGDENAVEVLGVTKAELSRRFGVSERTIYYWIAKGQLDRGLVV